MALLPCLVSSALLLTPGPAQDWTAAPLLGKPGRIPGPLIQIEDVGPYGVLASEGRWLLLFQDESSLDLNGDGDTLDHVFAVHDLVSGTTTSLGLAHRLDEPNVLAGGRALILVPEFEQGADLNGDGDIGDRVWFAVELASASATNSGLAGGTGGAVPVPGLLVGQWAVLAVSESAQGQNDLDASGTIGGSVLFSWDLVEATSPTSLLHAVDLAPVAHESFVLAGVSEQFYGASDPRSDLNGDGDSLDRILLVFDLNTSVPVNTQLTLVDAVQAVGSRSAIPVSEASEQADLNGDGDTTDSVLYSFDTQTGILHNFGLALQGGFLSNGHGGSFAKQFQLTEEALVFAVGEAKQGNTDLNGDGDALDTGVLFVHDFATGTTSNLALSAFRYEQQGRLLAMQVSEENQGVDLDGNGDLLDHVVHIYRLDDGSTWNLGLKAYATQGTSLGLFPMQGQRVAFQVPEAWEDDWNGDGDSGDLVLFTADATTEQVSNHAIAVLAGRFLYSPGGTLSFLVNEDDQGADLDGDGMTDHYVFHLLSPTGRVVNSGISSTLFQPVFPGVPHLYPISSSTGVLRVAHTRF